ncbi:hypothetical protein AMECASPLE_027495 [Ameca splendens]|uniref:Uncharacterized protein n=1 Tax=Ameca splendens TaxID=208324 RepID=A0ABV0Z4P6_9TELE
MLWVTIILKDVSRTYFLAEPNKCSLKKSWYFKEFMMPCSSTRFPGLFKEKQAHSITDPQSYLEVGLSSLSMYSSFGSCQINPVLQKSSMLVSPDQELNLKSQNSHQIKSAF